MYINCWQIKGVITPVNKLVDWVNKLQIVEKPDGSLRLCIDQMYLNKVVIKEMFTMLWKIWLQN